MKVTAALLLKIICLLQVYTSGQKNQRNPSEKQTFPSTFSGHDPFKSNIPLWNNHQPPKPTKLLDFSTVTNDQNIHNKQVQGSPERTLKDILDGMHSQPKSLPSNYHQTNFEVLNRYREMLPTIIPLIFGLIPPKRWSPLKFFRPIHTRRLKRSEDSNGRNSNNDFLLRQLTKTGFYFGPKIYQETDPIKRFRTFEEVSEWKMRENVKLFAEYFDTIRKLAQKERENANDLMLPKFERRTRYFIPDPPKKKMEFQTVIKWKETLSIPLGLRYSHFKRDSSRVISTRSKRSLGHTSIFQSVFGHRNGRTLKEKFLQRTLPSSVSYCDHNDFKSISPHKTYGVPRAEYTDSPVTKEPAKQTAKLKENDHSYSSQGIPKSETEYPYLSNLNRQNNSGPNSVHGVYGAPHYPSLFVPTESTKLKFQETHLKQNSDIGTYSVSEITNPITFQKTNYSQNSVFWLGVPLTPLSEKQNFFSPVPVKPTKLGTKKNHATTTSLKVAHKGLKIDQYSSPAKHNKNNISVLKDGYNGALPTTLQAINLTRGVSRLHNSSLPISISSKKLTFKAVNINKNNDSIIISSQVIYGVPKTEYSSSPFFINSTLQPTILKQNDGSTFSGPRGTYSVSRGDQFLLPPPRNFTLQASNFAFTKFQEIHDIPKVDRQSTFTSQQEFYSISKANRDYSKSDSHSSKQVGDFHKKSYSISQDVHGASETNHHSSFPDSLKSGKFLLQTVNLKNNIDSTFTGLTAVYNASKTGHHFSLPITMKSEKSQAPNFIQNNNSKFTNLQGHYSTSQINYHSLPTSLKPSNISVQEANFNKNNNSTVTIVQDVHGVPKANHPSLFSIAKPTSSEITEFYESPQEQKKTNDNQMEEGITTSYSYFLEPATGFRGQNGTSSNYTYSVHQLSNSTSTGRVPHEKIKLEASTISVNKKDLIQVKVASKAPINQNITKTNTIVVTTVFYDALSVPREKKLLVFKLTPSPLPIKLKTHEFKNYRAILNSNFTVEKNDTLSPLTLQIPEGLTVSVPSQNQTSESQSKPQLSQTILEAIQYNSQFIPGAVKENDNQTNVEVNKKSGDLKETKTSQASYPSSTNDSGTSGKVTITNFKLSNRIEDSNFFNATLPNLKETRQRFQAINITKSANNSSLVSANKAEEPSSVQFMETHNILNSTMPAQLINHLKEKPRNFNKDFKSFQKSEKITSNLNETKDLKTIRNSSTSAENFSLKQFLETNFKVPKIKKASDYKSTAQLINFSKAINSGSTNLNSEMSKLLKYHNFALTNSSNTTGSSHESINFNMRTNTSRSDEILNVSTWKKPRQNLVISQLKTPFPIDFPPPLKTATFKDSVVYAVNKSMSSEEPGPVASTILNKVKLREDFSAVNVRKNSTNLYNNNSNRSRFIFKSRQPTVNSTLTTFKGSNTNGENTSFSQMIDSKTTNELGSKMNDVTKNIQPNGKKVLVKVVKRPLNGTKEIVTRWWNNNRADEVEVV
ncbi:probable serine/threonine-protein kinase DDB_G0282963 [Anthonomus grandis grandis]|uniref:probable serine/threonine-protein kinase DDB_G0282963 n=1 Tax=Anthonomus grandis grandis TaxID=2921223 RepID=UPI0021667907|nr:probable serine/threonine-protein kinase DDB_G0282963 [Anthonomus grandis grandis]